MISERMANQILKNESLYRTDSQFRKMVDNTVYLSEDDKQHSQLAVDAVYGWQRPMDSDAA